MSLQDGIFAEQVENDVTLFSEDARRKRVLVFPPVNNYRRFVIHQLVQEHFGDQLKTFSIGQDLARRTVVCYHSDFIRDSILNGVPSREYVESTNSRRLDSACAAMGGEERSSSPGTPEHLRMRQVKSTPAAEIYRPPAARRASGGSGRANVTAVSTVAEASSSSSLGKSNRNRRPDRAVYVPKHRRSTESDEIAHTSDSSRKPSTSPNNVNGRAPSPSLSDNRQDSDPPICNKNYETSDRSNGENSTLPDDAALLGDDFRQEQLNSTDRSEPVRNSIENAPKSWSGSSDETIISDVRTGPECSAIAACRDNERERRDSLQHDDRVNVAIATQCPRIVSNVLIISDNKEQRGLVEDTNLKIGKETMPLKSPEKKVKKVARVKSKAASPPAPPVKLNRDECDWDSLFDDNGECLDPTLIEELTAAVGQVSIETPRNDYKSFSRPVEVSSDEFGHVVEIYNFPSDYKTSDLAMVFSPWKNGGFELKWVDDTHCLGVFSSPLVASEVLASDHPFVKTRPLSAATSLSKTKARKSAEFLQPYKSRPETCPALARRLVTGALGVRLATARQEREQEKAVLREAKEKRRLANKQREDVWEGIIAEK